MTRHHNNRVPATRGGPTKLTAAQIEKGVGLPPHLQQIGEEINARLEKLLEEAKELCDEGGFKLFKKKVVTAKDTALCEFNEKILRLVQMTRGRKPERFAKTSVPTSDLLQLGRFLEKVAAASEAMKAERALIYRVPGINPSSTPRWRPRRKAAQLSDAEQKVHAGDLEALS
jgi:hypothetical protein